MSFHRRSSAKSSAQIISTTTDASFNYAGIASGRLLCPRKNGALYGPRSPNDQKDELPAR